MSLLHITSLRIPLLQWKFESICQENFDPNLMESQQVDPQTQSQPTAPEIKQSNSTAQDAPTQNAPSILSSAGISSWAKNLKIPKQSNQDESQLGNSGKSPFARFTSGIGLRLSPRSSQQDENAQGTSATAEPGVFGSLTKGIMDSSRSAVKAVQVKARHIVSQNKRRYQEGGFDLDMTYITENIIAMGFPAGDMSSGFFGYVEGFYRNHMEEVIKFFETHHQGKYKVYNLCSERLYDASLFEGKVASFPFDDHNCPPIHLITLFCQSAYSWLKEDIENVVVVHCKAGMARTGLMISSLLLYLKFFPTAEESIDYYNQKRCIDGKGLVLPSQIRYVKYFERVLTYFSGENLPGRRCMLRGFRLHRCPYWIRPSITVSDHNGILFSSKKHPRTKDLSPEDYWFKAPKKGIMVFALPGEPGLTELVGDFKIHFHDGQGDFYCWLNTTMIENRMTLSTSDMDGFDKRKLPSPGFQVEIVLVDYDGTTAPNTKTPTANSESSSSPTNDNSTKETNDAPTQEQTTETTHRDKDDVFSDSDSESSKKKQDKKISDQNTKNSDVKTSEDETSNLAHGVHNVSLKSEEDAKSKKTSEVKSEDRFKSPMVTESQEVGSVGMSEFKAMAADASMFSFGDEDDYESE